MVGCSSRQQLSRGQAAGSSSRSRQMDHRPSSCSSSKRGGRRGSGQVHQAPRQHVAWAQLADSPASAAVMPRSSQTCFGDQFSPLFNSVNDSTEPGQTEGLEGGSDTQRAPAGARRAGAQLKLATLPAKGGHHFAASDRPRHFNHGFPGSEADLFLRAAGEQSLARGGGPGAAAAPPATPAASNQTHAGGPSALLGPTLLGRPSGGKPRQHFPNMHVLIRPNCRCHGLMCCWTTREM